MMDISLARYYKELEKIPWKRETESAGIEFLSEAEMKALLAQPDTATKKGVRDLLLMIMLYDTGARIQELLNLRICDIQFSKSPTVKVLGKGSKYRFIPVMPKTMEHIRKYMKLYHPGEGSYFAKYSDCKGKTNPTDIVCNAAVEYGYSRTALERRLTAKICELCGTTESNCYEIHHVNKLKNLKGKKAWEIIMIAKRRKTLVVCKKCHIAIHNQ